jgi:hypothetical protein
MHCISVIFVGLSTKISVSWIFPEPLHCGHVCWKSLLAIGSCLLHERIPFQISRDQKATQAQD